MCLVICFHWDSFSVLYAIELNKRRFKELNNNLRTAGVTCAKTINGDFLSVELPFDQIEFILLDPSCSGSGIRNRNDQNESIDEQRLERLTALQIRMVTYALTNFPNVKRVTYSTCSIHRQENEQVVETILDQFNDTFQVGSKVMNRMLNFFILVSRFSSAMAKSWANRKDSRMSPCFSFRYLNQWIFCCLFRTSNKNHVDINNHFTSFRTYSFENVYSLTRKEVQNQIK